MKKSIDYILMRQDIIIKMMVRLLSHAVTVMILDDKGDVVESKRMWANQGAEDAYKIMGEELQYISELLAEEKKRSYDYYERITR